MSDSGAHPDLWQRIFAAAVAGAISASLILVLLVYLVGFNFSVKVLGLAFFMGAMIALVHGIRTKSTSVGAGIIGAVWLVFEGMGLVFAAIMTSVVAVLSAIAAFISSLSI